MYNLLRGVKTDDIDASFTTFFDDIVFGAKTKAAFMILVGRILSRFIEADAKAKLPKCTFFKPSVDHCGLTLSEKGYCISEKRKGMLRKFPDFESKKLLKKNSKADLSHLGFLNWHRPFCENYSKHDSAIRKAIKQFREKEIDSVTCDKIVKVETDIIKENVLRTMLVSVDKNEEVILCCDASGHGWGAILFTKRGVISYMAGTFTESVIRSHDIFEKELKAIALSIQASFHFLCQAKKVVVKNDNASAVFVNQKGYVKQKITPRALKYI